MDAGPAAHGRPRAPWKAFLFRAASYLADRLLAASGLCVIYRTGSAIGDLVGMTAVIRERHGSAGCRSIVVSRRPEIFRGNPKVAANVDLSRFGARAREWLIRALDACRGPRVLAYAYQASPGSTFEEDMRRDPAGRHLIQIHSGGLPFRLPASALRPEIVLGADESRGYERAMALPPRFALIQSAGKNTYTPNKEWGPQRFQAVVDALPGTVFVQIGSPDDPPLAGAVDFRGRTVSLRELAFVISRAGFLVCLEGLYNHLAAAFGVKTFLIQGGFTHPELAAYPTTVTISRCPQVACAPCWLTTPCPVAGRPCLSDIAPETVVREVLKAFPEAAGSPGARAESPAREGSRRDGAGSA